MPAILDDPDAPTIYRVSGEPPYPVPGHPSLPATIVPRQVTLRDRQTVATIVPFASRHQVPPSLLHYLSDQFSKEVEGGDTYPMIDPMPFDKFAGYWFQNFGAVMLLGQIAGAEDVVEGRDWARECLGSFYIKPNYPGRSSHVCNAGFLVTDAARNRGVGRLMGESYIDWAPKLGYSYSVFNLVYETNVASCRIWDALGFKRIGRVKGCGNLKSYPGRLIDAIIYGRELSVNEGGAGGEDDLGVSDERFDKIKFYLKYGRYPAGADRAEKSRLRSAATHYTLRDGETLMLKDKEVIADGGRQYGIAKDVHELTHAGINKTTAIIAEKFHWSRIKETVSDVIRNCPQCQETGKTVPPLVNTFIANPAATTNPSTVNPRRSHLSPPASSNNNGAAGSTPSHTPTPPTPTASSMMDPASASTNPMLALPVDHQLSSLATPIVYANHDPMTVMPPSHALRSTHSSPIPPHTGLPRHNPMLQDHPDSLGQPSHHLDHTHHHAHHPSSLSHTHPIYPQPDPIDPQIISQPSLHHHNLHTHYDPDVHRPYFASYGDGGHEPDSFQALLHATDDDDDGTGTQERNARDAEREAMDRDLDMLLESQDDEEDDNDNDDDNAGGQMDIVVDGDGAMGSERLEGQGNGDGDGRMRAERQDPVKGRLYDVDFRAG